MRDDISCLVQRALVESLILRSTRVNGAITSSMAGDWTLSDALIDRFQYKNTNIYIFIFISK
jgi:hypothetical protein